MTRFIVTAALCVSIGLVGYLFGATTGANGVIQWANAEACRYGKTIDKLRQRIAAEENRPSAPPMPFASEEPETRWFDEVLNAKVGILYLVKVNQEYIRYKWFCGGMWESTPVFRVGRKTDGELESLAKEQARLSGFRDYAVRTAPGCNNEWPDGPRKGRT